MRVLVTGGCGFIGSHVVRLLLSEGASVVNLDKLTYAGNLKNLIDVAQDRRYRFVKGDICDPSVVVRAARGADGIVNLAAETHVDRSILNPGAFVRTDMLGTHVLLEEMRKQRMKFFVQVSTDEVYGSVRRGKSRETDPLHPTNPYSASKLGADRLAFSYFSTYGLRVMVTRGSNTYGPNQFPEKLIPLTILRALANQPVPIYGDGRNVRDWLHVEDHAQAICRVALKGKAGETYNVAGRNERENLWMARRILNLAPAPSSLIRFVKDRPGHDRRYALDDSKIRRELKWRPRKPDLSAGLAETVQWYRDNKPWWEPIMKKNAEFKKYLRTQYGKRW